MAEEPRAVRPVRISPILALLEGVVAGEVDGWRVPVSSIDPIAGLRAAREGTVLVDLAAYGRIKVTGKDRKDLLQRISTNDIRPLEPGLLAPTLFATPKGRIVGRALVLDRGDSLLVLTEPGGRERLAAWIGRYILAAEVRLTDLSRESSAFALAGPGAGRLVSEIAGVDVEALESRRFLGLPLAQVETLIAPWDGLPMAWLLLAETPGVQAVAELALAAGAPSLAVPIGAREADILRVEAGIPGDGHELTEDFNPWEVRLEGSLSLSKGCYTGQEVIARLRTYDKVQRRLVGVLLTGVEPPPCPRSILGLSPEGGEREIGTLTSAVRSERLGQTIGLAVVRTSWEEPGAELWVGEERSRATVVALPFV